MNTNEVVARGNEKRNKIYGQTFGSGAGLFWFLEDKIEWFLYLPEGGCWTQVRSAGSNNFTFKSLS